MYLYGENIEKSFSKNVFKLMAETDIVWSK